MFYALILAMAAQQGIGVCRTQTDIDEISFNALERVRPMMAERRRLADRIAKVTDSNPINRGLGSLVNRENDLGDLRSRYDAVEQQIAAHVRDAHAEIELLKSAC